MDLTAPDKPTSVVPVPFSGNGCRLRRSTQHLLAVYSQEFQSPAFFSGVDSGAARPGRDALASGQIGQCLAGSIAATADSCFRSSHAARDFVDRRSRPAHRGYRKLLVLGHLQSAIPRQRASQGCRKFANMFAQCRHDHRRVFARHLDQHEKTGMPLHECRNVAVLSTGSADRLPNDQESLGLRLPQVVREWRWRR